MPLPEKTVRQDLERTARKIVSQKLWPILDAAVLVGYSYNQMDLKITQLGWFAPRFGGRRHVYALDLLELWEEQTGLEFPDLAKQWCTCHKIEIPKKYIQTKLPL